MISSTNSGVGKSSYIKNIVKEENYLNFPIGWIFTKEDNLKILHNFDKSSLLYLDLYYSDQDSLINYFRFCFIH